MQGLPRVPKKHPRGPAKRCTHDQAIPPTKMQTRLNNCELFVTSYSHFVELLLLLERLVLKVGAPVSVSQEPHDMAGLISAKPV